MPIFDKDNQPLEDKAALQRHIDIALAVEQPEGLAASLWYQAVKRIFDPVVIGGDNIPSQPCLFVGNHSLFALDGWVLGPVMQQELGRFVRALGDKFLFTVPSVGDRLLQMGAVMGHPDVCSALMQNGQDLMVFPGGAHEAVKPSRDIYALQWKERFGFVRLAARHGYTIVPFGMVGPDEFYNHLIEGEDLPDSALGQLMRRLGLLGENTRSDMLPPIPVGALGTLFPKPKRCYIGFGEPIDLSRFEGRTPTPRQQRAIRDQVASGIETQLSQLLFARAQRGNSDGLLRRVLSL